MMKQSTILGSLASLGVLLGITSGAAVAQMDHEGMQPIEQTEGFQRIDQPLWVKGAVTAGGLGLIGLEVWWFLLNKPKSRKAATQAGVQEITVTVDGGYEPSQIVVQAGQPVRLNFDRKDPSSCLEEVRFPDFRIAQTLPLNQITAIEFIPDKPGQYEFTCGMNMFRGVVEVQAGDQPTTPVATVPQPTHSVAPIHYPVDPAVHSTSSVEVNMTPTGIQEATVTVGKG
jgi:plastocyanin domain-containing protein